MRGVEGDEESLEGGGGPVGVDFDETTKVSVAVVRRLCEMKTSIRYRKTAALRAGTACLPRAVAMG